MPSLPGLLKAFIAIAAFAIVAFGGGAFIGAPPWGGAGDDDDRAAMSAPSGESVASAAMVDAVVDDDSAPKTVAEDLDPAMLGGKAARTFANLDSSLDAVASAAESGAGDAALREALENAPMRNGDAIAVSVRAQRDISGAKDFLASNGVPIDYSGRTWLEAYVPADLLGALSGQADVVSVSPIIPAVTTQTAPAPCALIDLGTISADITPETETWDSACQSQEPSRLGHYAEHYQFTITDWGAVDIRLESSDADAYLAIRSEAGTLVGTPLHEDDNSGGGTNARIYEVLPTETYVIEATTANAGATGDFTLTLEYSAVTTSGSDCVTDLGTLNASNLVAADQTWTTACDSARVAGRHAKFYTFTVAASQHRFMQAWLTRAEGQLFLTKGGTGRGMEWVAGFDDHSNKVPSGGKLANKVEWFLGAGTYTIEAANANPGTEGKFRLVVDPDSVNATSGTGCTGDYGGNAGHSQGTTFLVRFRWNACGSANDNEFVSFKPLTRSLVTIDYFPYNFNTTTDLTFRNDSGVLYSNGGTAPRATGRITHSMVLRGFSAQQGGRRHYIFPITSPKGQSGDYGMRVSIAAVPSGTSGNANSNVAPPTPAPPPAACTDTSPSGSARTMSLDLTGTATDTDAWALVATCGSRNRTGAYGRLYELTLAQRANLTLTATSDASPSDADLYLYLMEDTIANEGAVIAEDDDSAAGVNPRIGLVESPITLDAGTYTVEVTTNGLADAGSYTLIAAVSNPYPENPALEAFTNACDATDLKEIHNRITRSGTWDENCESEAQISTPTGKRLHADYYTFNLPVDSFAFIEANAGGAQPRLYLRPGAPSRTVNWLPNGDDAGADRARVRRFLFAGSYTIEVAQPDNSDLANDYELTIAVANVESGGCSADLGTMGPLDGGWARDADGCSSSRYSFTLSEAARASFQVFGAAGTLTLRADSGNQNRIADYANNYSNFSFDWSDTVYLPKGGYTLTASAGASYVAAALDAPLAGGAPALHNIPQWRALGYTGQGVKVAVVDSGFAGYDRLVGVELPAPAGERCADGAPSDCLSAAASGDSHGASAAEALHDAAPNADIYLTTANTPGELSASVDWMLANGVDVAAASLSFPWDGPPSGATASENAVGRSIGRAARGGVTWVNSAGGDARYSWRAAYADADADNLVDFDTGDETNAVVVRTAGVYAFEMRWDSAWGGADRDLDLYLVDSLNNVVARSENYQTGSAGHLPLEAITVSLAPGHYRLVARQDSGTDPAWVQIRNFGGVLPLEHLDPAGSVASPAEFENPAIVAVGAANYYDASEVAPYSARGPSGDGRTKPDVVGADADLSAAAGETRFAGASQAAPYVAGLAALVKQRYPDYGPVQLARYLRDLAEPRAPSGSTTASVNNEWGYGLAKLPHPGVDPFGKAVIPAGVVAGDRVGWSVDVADNGNTAVAGAPNADGATGAAYVNLSAAWGTGYKLTGTGTGEGSEFGYSAAISGDAATIAIGAPGHNGGAGTVFVFQAPGTGWAAAASAVTLSATSADANAGDRFGASVSISADGSRIAVGAPGDDGGEGAAYVFHRPAGSPATWATTDSPAEKLAAGTGADSEDAFGTSVSVSGTNNVIAAGAPGADSAYVFAYDTTASAWPSAPTATLTSDTAATGDRFGFSVSVANDGNSIAVGAPSDEFLAPGTAQVFVASTTWSDQTAPTSTLRPFPALGVVNNLFGRSVAMSGDGTSVAVSASSINAGSVYKFARGTAWADTADRVSGGALVSATSLNGRGWSVANSENGNVVVYGEPWHSSGRGVAWRKAGVAAAVTLGSGAAASERYGFAAALNDDKSVAVVSASATPNEVDPSVLATGAAYVFTNPFDSAGAPATAAKLQLGQTDSMGNVPTGHNSDSRRQGFGRRIAISGDGNVIAISSDARSGAITPGIYVFTKPEGGWGSASITSGYAVLVGHTTNAQGYGASHAINRDGSVIIVGMTRINGTPDTKAEVGGALVFTMPTGGWSNAGVDSVTSIPTMTMSDSRQVRPNSQAAHPHSNFARRGMSVAVSADGSTVAIGAPREKETGSQNTTSNWTGAVHLVERDPINGWGTGGTWWEGARVVKYTSWSTAETDRFGASVALSENGDTLFAGAPEDNGGTGGVFVINRPDAGWTPRDPTTGSFTNVPADYTWNLAGYDRRIVPAGARPGDRIGDHIALSADGSRLLIGSSGKDLSGRDNAGGLYVFNEPVGGWTGTTVAATSTAPSLASKLDGVTIGANLGVDASLSADGNFAFAAAPNHDRNAGAAYIYDLRPTAPSPPTVSVSDTRAVDSTSAGRFIRFPVALSARSDQRVTVEYATTDGGSASAGSDYVESIGAVSFAPGETRKTARVRLTGARPGETVRIALSAPTNAELGDSTATGTVPIPRTPAPGTGGGSNGGGGSGAAARITTGADLLTFSVDLDGDERASKTLEVWNARSGGMSFSVSENAGWLSVSPASARSDGPNDRERISVTADGGGLSEGRYTAAITISASGASDKTVSVRMDVSRSESARAPVAPAPPVAAPPAPAATPAPGTTPAPTPAQRIATPDGTILLIVPAGATDQPVEIEAQNRAPDAFGAPPAAASGERAVNAVSVNTYARGGEQPLEITYNAWLSLRFTMPTGLGDACADGRARVYRVSGATWTPVPHRCETDEATGETYAVVLLNRFSDYVLTVAQAAPATPTPQPTATPIPPTATPEPTATPVPPTATPAPPAATPVPPTATPIPPTATATPPPFIPTATATAVPPTATPVIVAQAPPTATPQPPAPTATAMPPTATPVPTAVAIAQPTSTPSAPPPPAPEADGGGGISGILIAIIAIIVLAAAGGGGYYALRQRGMIG